MRIKNSKHGERPAGQPAPPDWVDEKAVPQPSRNAQKGSSDVAQNNNLAPSGKAWAGVAGSSLGTNLAVVFTYYLDLPWEVALACSGVLITLMGGIFYYLQPPKT